MIRTAADTWRRWVRDGLLKPDSYDEDIAEHLRDKLGVPAGAELDPAMDVAGWTARDLLRVLAPHVSSFAGMERDILRLLERIGARAGTKDNLRLSYEFDENDFLDQSLQQFREAVLVAESVLIRMATVTFPDGHMWSSPLSQFRSGVGWPTEGLDDGDTSQCSYASALPSPVLTGSKTVDDLVARYEDMIDEVRKILATIGDNDDEVSDWLRKPEHAPDPRDHVAELASDHWVTFESLALRDFADAAVAGEDLPDAPFIQRVVSWLDEISIGAATVSQTQLVQQFEDVLSLPMWGKRHELYSVWILSQIDLALGSDRTTFVVTGGTLKLPFRRTHIATMPSLAGTVELWSERRSDATKLLGKGRKKSIQPDYRFVLEDDTDALLIEVKQYLSAAASRHSEVLHDYVTNTLAHVFLVGHGPLGDDLQRKIPSPQQHRAHAFQDVRPGQPATSRAFREAVSGHLPERPLLAIVSQLSLSWDPGVRDLDLHIQSPQGEVSYRHPTSEHLQLRSDELDGGPEIVDVVPRATPFVVLVHVYAGTDIVTASPVVTIVHTDGTIAVATPSQEVLASDRWWVVGSVDVAGAWMPSAQSLSESSF